MSKHKKIFWFSLSALILFLMSSAIYIFNYITNLWLINVFYGCIPTPILSHWSIFIAIPMFLLWFILLGLYAYIKDWKQKIKRIE